MRQPRAETLAYTKITSAILTKMILETINSEPSNQVGSISLANHHLHFPWKSPANQNIYKDGLSPSSHRFLSSIPFTIPSDQRSYFHPPTVHQDPPVLPFLQVLFNTQLSTSILIHHGVSGLPYSLLSSTPLMKECSYHSSSQPLQRRNFRFRKYHCQALLQPTQTHLTYPAAFPP